MSRTAKGNATENLVKSAFEKNGFLVEKAPKVLMPVFDFKTGEIRKDSSGQPIWRTKRHDYYGVFDLLCTPTEITRGIFEEDNGFFGNRSFPAVTRLVQVTHGSQHLKKIRDWLSEHRPLGVSVILLQRHVSITGKVSEWRWLSNINPNTAKPGWSLVDHEKAEAKGGMPKMVRRLLGEGKI